MSEEKLLTIRDAASILGISEKEVLDLVEKGTLPAYKIGGVYVRFKKEQIQDFLKHTHLRSPQEKLKLQADYPLRDKISDFFYFNDFYLVTILIASLLLLVIFRGY